MVTCYSRIGALGRCSGPAMINVSSCQWFENTPVQESKWVGMIIIEILRRGRVEGAY